MEKNVPVLLVVPVRPAVEKYLRRKLHLAPEEFFQLTKKGCVGRALYHMLRNPQQDRQYDSAAGYPGRFHLTISNQMSWYNSCRHLTAQTIHDFNRQVEDMIEDDFHKMLDTLAGWGIQFETKAVALRFMDQNGFTEEDLTLDALLKSYYRYRKAQVEAKLRLQIPKCPAALPLAA